MLSLPVQLLPLPGSLRGIMKRYMFIGEDDYIEINIDCKESDIGKGEIEDFEDDCYEDDYYKDEL